MNEYTYKNIKKGQCESFKKEITKEMEDAFRTITNDENPLHRDDSFAIEISEDKFKSHVVFGMLTASLLSTFAGVYLPGKYSLIHSIDNISFKKPVYVGDIITVSGIVEEKQEGLNLIILKVKMINQNNKTVFTANMKVLVQK